MAVIMPSIRAVIRILTLLIVDLPTIASLLIARLPASAFLVTSEPDPNDACGVLRRQPRDPNRRRAGNRRHHGTGHSDEKQTRCIFHMGLIEPISVNPGSQLNCGSVPLFPWRSLWRRCWRRRYGTLRRANHRVLLLGGTAEIARLFGTADRALCGRGSRRDRQENCRQGEYVFHRRFFQSVALCGACQRAGGRFSLTCCGAVAGRSSRAHLRQSSDAQFVGQPPPSAMKRAALSERRVACACTLTTAAVR
ncbi:hypothetical protein ACVW1C_000909 [Bradyrhizobium sp. USDA 4011]